MTTRLRLLAALLLTALATSVEAGQRPLPHDPPMPPLPPAFVPDASFFSGWEGVPALPPFVPDVPFFSGWQGMPAPPPQPPGIPSARAGTQNKQRSEREEARLYTVGQRSLDESRWEDALRAFSRLAEMKGTRAAAALYWMAYAQNRLGQRPEALQTIADLQAAHPGSRYSTQARALEVEVRRDAGQPVRPESEHDEELKLIALSALQRSDPERAIPMLEGILRGTAAPRVKTRALFVLAQSESPRAQQTLADVARGTSSPELQEQAVDYLGIRRSATTRTVLSEVYAATSEVEVKRRVLRAFTMAGDKERLLTAASNERITELRVEAVRQLGAMRAQAELAQLYGRESIAEVKQQILQSMAAGGDATRLIELARAEPSVELRRMAVRNLGMMGAQRTGPALLEIFSADKDAQIRRAVVAALFLQGNADALVALARKETDPPLKREIVEKLSQMRSQAALDYLLELLK